MANIFHSIKMTDLKRKIDIATIVVNYKSEARTIAFIKEELSKCKLRQAIVIVNNGATEDSSSIMAKALDATIVRNNNEMVDDNQLIYVMHNPINSGFAKGNNMGVDFIVNHFVCDYLLISNNDIQFVDDNVIEALIEKIKILPDVGVIGPKVIGLDGHCQSPSDDIPFWTRMVGLKLERFIPYLHIKMLNQDEAKEGYYYRVMGSFFICSTTSFIECDMMDPATFLYAEELCLAERMLRTGKKAYYYPDVIVLHEHGATINKNMNYLRGQKILFESLSYYYRTYKKVSAISILLAKMIDVIYTWMFWCKRTFHI